MIVKLAGEAIFAKVLPGCITRNFKTPMKGHALVWDLGQKVGTGMAVGTGAGKGLGWS